MSRSLNNTKFNQAIAKQIQEFNTKEPTHSPMYAQALSFLGELEQLTTQSLKKELSALEEQEKLDQPFDLSRLEKVSSQEKTTHREETSIPTAKKRLETRSGLGFRSKRFIRSHRPTTSIIKPKK